MSDETVEPDEVEKSFLTDAEVEEIQSLALPRKTPYVIRGVSMSMFSVARFYGAAVFEGEHYSYVPTTDELIRDDVLKAIMKMRETKVKARPSKAKKEK